MLVQILTAIGLSLAWLATAQAAAGPGELSPAIPVTAAGQPIDVAHAGNAAPFMADIDGDGRPDLLVGERFDGRLRIYRNVGTRTEPKFDKYEWFQAGAQIGRVPGG